MLYKKFIAILLCLFLMNCNRVKCPIKTTASIISNLVIVIIIIYPTQSIVIVTIITPRKMIKRVFTWF